MNDTRYEVRNGEGMFLASSTDLGDAYHYAMQYAEDEETVEVVRVAETLLYTVSKTP